MSLSKIAPLFLAGCLICAGFVAFKAWQLQDNVTEPALVSHRAMYDVSLSSLSSSGNMVSLKGLMVYEWRKTCNSWTTKTNSTLTYGYADGQNKTVNTNVLTVEDRNGQNLMFETKRESGGVLDEEIVGSADHTQAVFTKPMPKTMPLAADVLFPMQHTMAAYKHAKAGDTQFSARVFDGADSDGPMLVNTLISPIALAKPITDKPHIDNALLTPHTRPYRFSFFKDTAEDGVPEYEMQVMAQDNGIVRSLEILYDGFSVQQTLKALQPLDDGVCQH